MKEFQKFLSSKGFLYVSGTIIVVLILRNWGLLKGTTSAEKQIEKAVQEIKGSVNIWSTNFWLNYPAKAYTNVQAKNLADHIKNSFSIWGDDEARIEGVFRQIKYQTNVSQIADQYTKNYGRDLLSDLIDRLSTKEMENNYYIISQKPL